MVCVHPIERMFKEHQECIDCGAPYKATEGTLIWQGKDRQYCICPECAPMVVAGLANDLADLLYGTVFQTGQKTPAEHYIIYLQRAAHAIQVKRGLRPCSEAMSKKGKITDFMKGT